MALNKYALADWSRKLDEKEAALRQIVASHEAAFGDHFPQADRLDRAVTSRERTCAGLILEKFYPELRHIGIARDRIRNGSFGICDSCGATISEKRLDAIPHTRCCLACGQQKEDEEEGRKGPRLSLSGKITRPQLPA